MTREIRRARASSTNGIAEAPDDDTSTQSGHCGRARRAFILTRAQSPCSTSCCALSRWQRSLRATRGSALSMQACRELGTARRDSAQHARTAPRGRLRTREARPYYYSTDFSCATVHRRRCRGPSTTTSLDQRPAPRRRTPAVVERSTPMMFRTIRSALRPARPSSKERRDDVHSGRRSGRQRRHQAPFEEAPILP